MFASRRRAALRAAVASISRRSNYSIEALESRVLLDGSEPVNDPVIVFTEPFWR